MKWRQIIIAVLVLAAIGAGLVWAFRPQPIGVDLGHVERGTLTVTVNEEGLVRIRDLYQVSTPVTGDLQRIPLKVGDPVYENEVIATIIPQQSGFLDERSRAEAQASVGAAEAAVGSAKAELAGAQSDLEFWQGEMDRMNALLERELVTARDVAQTRAQLEQRRVMVENATAALSMRERQLDQAEARLLGPNGVSAELSRYEIRSPANGEILEIASDSSRSIAAGSPVMTIGNPRDLEVVVDLLSTDAVRVTPGAPATIDGWGRDAVLDATVRSIEPIGFTKVSALGIEEQRVRVHLDITTPKEEWQSLGHLYRVFVRIETQRIEDAYLVPTAALFRDNDEWAMFTVNGDTAHLRPVKLGPRNANTAALDETIEEGTPVILHPNDRIGEGSLVADRAAAE